MTTSLRKLLPLAAVLSLVGSTLGTLSSQPAPGEATDQLSLMQAVNLLRTINTAELELSIKTNGYVSLDALAHRFLQRIAQGGGESGSVTIVSPNGRQNGTPGRLVMIDSSSGTLTNYRIFVIASGDGRHYQAGITPIKPGCVWALFSNESGIIYPALALGCPSDNSPLRN